MSAFSARRLPFALLLALAGCKALLNKDFTGGPAPPIEGGTWVGGSAPSGEWRLLTFFDPARARSAGRMPRLAGMQREFGPRGVAVIAATEADAAAAARFAAEHEAPYAILAEASLAFERYGIGGVDWAPVYAIDPHGRILAEGFDDCAEILRERLGSP